MSRTSSRATLAVGALLLMSSPHVVMSQEGTASQTPQAPIGSGAKPPDTMKALKEQSPVLQVRNPRYRLRKGDTFDVVFSYVPAFNQTVTVQPDGYVTLRGVGDQLVEGKTVPELTQALRAEYAKVLLHPVIAVELKDFEKPYFIVSGEVEQPGKYELRGETTVTEAVAIAGGFRGHAKHSEVLLFRRASDRWVEVKKLNLKKMLQAADLQEDPYLKPGDMLFVPKSRLGKIKSFLPRLSVGPRIRPY